MNIIKISGFALAAIVGMSLQACSSSENAVQSTRSSTINNPLSLAKIYKEKEV
ncbi:hypothetical protein [Pseudoalteromonas mariniglutinosa]|uniref:hypothetical protein n=1 Tax=Pseudoalteromonas mariniglutinosa TaxID=206042 RepID=UPI00384A9748